MDVEKLRQAAERYNKRATAEGWKSRCDPMLMFDHASLCELLHAWVRLSAAGLPRRDAFDLRSLKPVLPQLCIAERMEESGGHYWRWRLFGTKLAALLGEFTGKRLDEALPPEHVARWSFGYDVCLESGQPMRIASDFQINRMDHLSGETLVLPLANEKDEAKLVFAVALVRMKETAIGPYG